MQATQLASALNLAQRQQRKRSVLSPLFSRELSTKVPLSRIRQTSRIDEGSVQGALGCVEARLDAIERFPWANQVEQRRMKRGRTPPKRVFRRPATTLAAAQSNPRQ